MSQFLLYPPIAFIILSVVGYLVYRLGRILGPKASFEEGKISTYACGEDIPGKKIQHAFQLFHIAFFFTVLHIAALMIATVPSGGIALLGVIYLIIVLIAITILLVD